jgi:RNA recognition motif-containing protein
MEIYIEGLPLKLREPALREIFEKYGKVHAVKIIFDLKTRKSKGFGFVEMFDPNQAQHAISELNGAIMDDKPLVVHPARFSKSGERTYSERPPIKDKRPTTPRRSKKE